MRTLFLVLILFELTFFAGCSASPGHRLSALDINSNEVTAQSDQIGYQIVPMSKSSVSISNAFRPAQIHQVLRNTLGRGQDAKIGAGDRLIVNIWEPSSDGVFTTVENKQASLAINVDEEGMIYMPYAGRLRAQGQSVESLRKVIESSLRGKAVEPQVQVRLEESVSNAVVMLGDIGKPGQLLIPSRGLKLLDAIALGGGARSALFESMVTVTRGADRASLWLNQIMDYPANNIWLMKGDSIMVEHRPRTFSAFGAVQQSGLHNLQGEAMSLIEALALVRGINNEFADDAGIFLFRYEDSLVASALRQTDSRNVPNNKASSEFCNSLLEQGKRSDSVNTTSCTHGSFKDAKTPVVYRLDFGKGDAFFLAQIFKIRDKDVLYVAQHPVAEFSRFISMVVSPLLGTAKASSF